VIGAAGIDADQYDIPDVRAGVPWLQPPDTAATTAISKAAMSRRRCFLRILLSSGEW